MEATVDLYRPPNPGKRPYEGVDQFKTSICKLLIAGRDVSNGAWPRVGV